MGALTEPNTPNKREDIADEFTIVDMKACPITTAIRKGPAPNDMLFEYPLDKYASPALGGRADGTDVTSGELTNGLENATKAAARAQWFHKAVGVGKIAGTVAIRVPTITAGTGSTGLTLFVIADGNELGQIQATTEETVYEFTHAGGDCLIELDAQYEGNGDVTFEIAGIAVRPVQPYDNGQNTPAAPGESWALVPFPKILAEAVKHGGLASWRRTEGQDASAMQLENIMSEWLDHELDLICHQQQQGKHWRR